MARNEKTSKRVASKASLLNRSIYAVSNEIADIERVSMDLAARISFILPMVRLVLEEAKSVAGSALTQAPDKKPRPTAEDKKDIRAAKRVLAQKNRTWTQDEVERSLGKKKPFVLPPLPRASRKKTTVKIRRKK